MANEIDLSHLETASDVDLFRGAVGAMQYSVWRSSGRSGQHARPLVALPEAYQVVLRLSAFVALFGNGGLQHWFETDDPDLHPATASALKLVGLERSSRFLARAYSLFDDRDAWGVYDERMEALSELHSEFRRCEDEIWLEFDGMEAAGGRFVRGRLDAFRLAT